MRVDAAGDVARVLFDIELNPTRTGTYSATAPLGESGEAPLEIRTAHSAAAGAASGLWQAASGVVVISVAQHFGERGIYGWAAGTIDAPTLSRDGTSVRITGMWQCVIDRGANGN